MESLSAPRSYSVVISFSEMGVSRNHDFVRDPAFQALAVSERVSVRNGHQERPVLIDSK